MIRVFLVDDHSVFRAGVRAELAAVGSAGTGAAVEVVGEAGTVADAVAGIVRTRPDVVLLDVHMPDGGGLAVMRGVVGTSTSAKFLALSVSCLLYTSPSPRDS